MEEKLDTLQKSIDDLTAAVVRGFTNIEARMVTKEELAAVEEKLGSKIDGLGRRIDGEVEKAAQLETRIRKVEEVVSPD